MVLAFLYALFYFILGHAYLVTEAVRARRVAARGAGALCGACGTRGAVP